MAKQTFEVFIEGSDDVIGAVSYGLYKQHKASFVRDYMHRNGHPPAATDLDLFVGQCLLPEALDGYRQRAQLICSTWLNLAIESKVQEVATSTRNSELVKTLSYVVQSKMDERRTWSGWLRDAGTAVMTNALALILVGLLGFGVKLYDVFNSKVERVVKIHAPAPSSAR